jgi:hypothetical protein
MFPCIFIIRRVRIKQYIQVLYIYGKLYEQNLSIFNDIKWKAVRLFTSEYMKIYFAEL